MRWWIAIVLVVMGCGGPTSVSELAPSTGRIVIDGVGIGPIVDCSPLCTPMEATAEAVVARRFPGASVAAIAWHDEALVNAFGQPLLANRSLPFAVAVVRLNDGVVTAIPLACGFESTCFEVATR